MSASWLKRKTRLNALLGEQDNEDAQGLALDRILHGQSVIGKTGVRNPITRIFATETYFKSQNHAN